MVLNARWIAAICAVGIVCAGSASAAYAGAPRWYANETGVRVPLDDQSGLVELNGSPEALQGLGGLKVFGRKTKPSECLAKDRLSIANPPAKSSPGTSEMQEFEILCEKQSGFGNYAEPYPCAGGEPFEVKATHLNWSSTLELGQDQAQKQFGHILDNFANASVEVYCMAHKESDIYSGTLKPEVGLGRFDFRGLESGELVDSHGNHIYFQALNYVAPAKYKAIRALSEYGVEHLEITALSPNGGPSTGGTNVTIFGSGFALGDETTFKFGKTSALEVNCIVTTECVVISPPGKEGLVRVVATTATEKSKKNAAGDGFTYE